jgi:hypothetical protein
VVDIVTLGKNSIRLKGKKVSFVVDPSKEMPKISSDAIILLNGSANIDTSRVTDWRIIITGAGGYEVGGAKISGSSTSKGILYKLFIDDVVVILGRAMDSKIEGFSTCQVAVVNTDSDFNESFVTTLEPKIAVLYGDKKVESAKALGAGSISLVSKITTAKDKLPEKMEVVALG